MAEINKNQIASKDAFDNITNGAKAAKVEVVKLEDSLKDLLKIQKEAIKTKPDPKTAKERKAFIKDTQKAEKTVKTLTDTQKVHLQIEKEEAKALLKLKKLNTDKIQETVQLNRLSREQNQINKDTEILNNKKVGTLVKLGAANRKLQREINSIVITGKKEEIQIAKINKKINENNKIIEKNSSKLKQQKMNVGNYTDSIKEAAGASGLFGGVLGKLTAVQGVLNALTKRSVVTEEADVVAKTAQSGATTKLTVAQRGLNLATGAGTKALKLMKVALASTGIGAIALLLGGLIAFFTRAQDGVDALSDKTAQFTAVLDIIIDRISLFGRGIIKIFSGLGDELKRAQIRLKIFLLEAVQFDAFGKTINDNTKAVAELKEEMAALSDVSEGLDLIKQAFAAIGDELEREVALSKILNKLTRDLTREQKLFEAQQAAGLTIAKEQELISKDKLRSDKERIAALNRANIIFVDLAEKELKLQNRALASALDSVSADQKRLELGAEQLDFIERIKNGQIDSAEAVKLAADFTLSSAAGEEALFDIIDKIVAQEQAKLSLVTKQVKVKKALSALEIQIATKNAMARVREAAALRQLAKDQEKTIENRIDLLEQAAEKEIESFEIQTLAHIKNEEELAAAIIQIRAKLKADTDKLRQTDETDNSVELKRLATEEKIREETLEGEIEANERLLDNEKLTAVERVSIINEIFKLRIKQLEAIAKFESELADKTKEERELIAEALDNELKALEHDRVQAVKDANALILDDDKATADKRKEEARKLANDVSKEFTKQLKERNAETNKAFDEQIKSAQDAVNLQADIARNGGENILAEEQARLDKARLAKQRELERQRKQEQNIALATAFVNNYSTRTKSAKNKAESDAAFGLALRDTLLAKGIAKGLSGFFDGTENTGNGGNLDSKGGHLAVLHPNERVMTAKQNAMVGNMSNSELAQLAYDHNTGQLFTTPNGLDRIQGGRQKDNAMIQNIQSQTSELKAALQKYQSTTNVNWNSLNETIEREIKKGLTIKTKHTRPRL